MAFVSNENNFYRNGDDKVVISGLSGVFPKCDSVTELRERLFNKEDLITDVQEFPGSIGLLKSYSKFDAVYFGIRSDVANWMDPMSRLLLEKTCEAIFDAGYNPETLRGTRTGVFVGCFRSEMSMETGEKLDNYGLIYSGSISALLANRISFWLNLHGPSYVVDTACSSSGYALHQARMAILNGECDCAIVCGCNLCVTPDMSYQHLLMHLLSSHGRCKSFDKEGDGYARSEAISVIFLQKLKDARRVYAEIVHTACNNKGFNETGPFSSSGQMQRKLIDDFYAYCGVPRELISWVETHGTGTKSGDTAEIEAVEAFCENRRDPLLIGSVKSNMGHSEGASAICSIAKIIIAMESGSIPPNIHYKEPPFELEAIRNRKVQVITETVPWDGGLVAVNNFGIGGSNFHGLLKSFEKIKTNTFSSTFPYLVNVSGRTKEAVNTILSYLESVSEQNDMISLLHQIYNTNIAQHLFRGYTILKQNLKSITYTNELSRPLWFVFSGMGSQWPQMAKTMIQIPLFADSIEKCHNVLSKIGYNLKATLLDNMYKDDSLLHQFVHITAMQIALVDVVKSINVTANGIIGHSFGEIACGYYDGCLTLEEAILSSYYRGISTIGLDLISGAMAVVGLSYDDLLKRCPIEIDIACHNGPDSCTISGPTEIVSSFTTRLRKENIFTMDIYTANVAYHSRYIKDVGPVLLNHLKKIIRDPKPRSEKWLSTSFSETDRGNVLSKYCSAEYFTHNLLSPVNFKEVFERIPSNAIILEIAPHAALTSLWKRHVTEECVITSLMNKYYSDNCVYFLTTLGILYENGVMMDVSKLYPPAEFPVSKGTPMISPLICWDHSVDWHVPFSEKGQKIFTGERAFYVSLNNEHYTFMENHIIDGKNLLPAAGYLWLVWQTFAMMYGRDYRTIPVQFEKVTFKNALILSEDEEVKLFVSIHKGNGSFEISRKEQALVTGYIDYLNESNNNLDYLQFENFNDPKMDILEEDIYKEFSLRGYNYKNDFRAIISCNINQNCFSVKWNNNWVTFLDSILQCNILHHQQRKPHVIQYIERLSIDVIKHSKLVADTGIRSSGIKVVYDVECNVMSSGSVILEGLHITSIMRRILPHKLSTLNCSFTPYMNSQHMDINRVMSAILLILADNMISFKFRCAEVCSTSNFVSTPLLIILNDVVVKMSNSTMSATIYTDGDVQKMKLPTNIVAKNYEYIFCLPKGRDFHLVLCSGIIGKPKVLETIIEKMTMNNGFVALQEDEYLSVPIIRGATLCAKYQIPGKQILLFRKVRPVYNDTKYFKMPAYDKFSWVPEVQSLLSKYPDERLILVVEKQPFNGILGFFKCIRKEIGSHNLRCIFIIDEEEIPDFSPSESFYVNQLSGDLAFNVYKDGVWGCYVYFSQEPEFKGHVPHAFLVPYIGNDGSSLNWIQGSFDPSVGSNKDELVHVHYAAFNMKDVLIATNYLTVRSKYDKEVHNPGCMGFDFAGMLPNGKRIFGISPLGGSFSTLLSLKDAIALDVPDEWSLEDAVTIPTVYITVLAGLIAKASIKLGDSILIHGGSGGIGLAAINVAKHFGCIVYTTVGSSQKRDYIKREFPFIKDTHIFSSKDEMYDKILMRETNGNGVDIIINAYSGRMKQATLRCLSSNGRFIDIIKISNSDNVFDITEMSDERSYHYLRMDEIYRRGKLFDSYMKLVAEGIQLGYVKPLKRTVFNGDEPMKALRHMSSDTHIGKIVLKIRDEEPVNSSILTGQATLRFLCLENSTFIICGGLGGMGLEYTDWFIDRGVRNFVLVSRSGIQSGYQKLCLHRWKSMGINVIISTANIFDEQGVIEIIDTANKMAPVYGIINSTLVLKDMQFVKQSMETFELLFGSKAKATALFDHFSRTMCPLLRYFIVFSSIACGYGYTGQSNYGYANSVMERICEKRRKDGYPALVIQWGGIGDVGALAHVSADAIIQGTLIQPIRSCFDVTDGFLCQPNTIVLSAIFTNDEGNKANNNSIGIIGAISRIIGIKDLSAVDKNTKLYQLGLDSIATTELKQILEIEYDVFVTAKDIISLSIEDIQNIHKRKNV